MEDFNKKTGAFQKELDEIRDKYRSNIQYFIYKSIILRNLYGVDIMHEAVEIAKLRLFLKMVAVVEVDKRADNLGLDPLPDIDFNVRCGNTLVGFANEEELERSFEGNAFEMLKKGEIEAEMADVAKIYDKFRQIQLDGGDLAAFKESKKNLLTSLKTLNKTLDKKLFATNGMGKTFDEWKHDAQPFHWLSEFYQIIHGHGGFDVIIGNPPYVEYSKVRKSYSINDISCLSAGNLYAYVIEKSLKISHESSRNGMIIQMSAFCTPRMESFQKIWYSKAKFSAVGFFDDRPGKLFDNLEHIRVVIPLLEYGMPEPKTATSNYVKFYSDCRADLFKKISYFPSILSRKKFSLLKINSDLEESIVSKVWKKRQCICRYEEQHENKNFMYYGYGYGYFGKILNYKSYFNGEKISVSTGDKYYYFSEDFDKDTFVGLVNSSLFYWFYVNYSDGHNFTKTVIGSMPFEYEIDIKNALSPLVKKLMVDLEKKSNLKVANYKSTGKVEYKEYHPKLSKPIIDEIDQALAKYYGFTEEELDFIINYDIKYRMGDELNQDEELPITD